MSSKRDYFMQKGRQMQLLDEQISAAPGSGNASREVAKYRELCPPGTPDTQIQVLIGQCKGDAQRMENAINELWEDCRGTDQDWATVSKKASKKKNDHSHSSQQRSYSSQKTQPQLDDHADAPQDGDAQPAKSSERFSTRGRGSMRGRGMVSTRGGRGGRGGRGRGGAVVATSSTRSNRNADNEEESPENDSNSIGGSSPSNEARVQQSSKAAKDLKRDRGAKTAKTTTMQPAQQAPPVVYPVLTGAWTKKLNVAGVTSKPKSVEPVPAPTSAAAPAATSKPAEKPGAPAAETEVAPVTVSPEAPKPASPKKKAQKDKKNKKTQQSNASESVEETVTAVVENTETVKTVEKVTSPKASPKKTVETKKKAKIVETTIETSASNITAGWGTLDVSTSTMGEWSSAAPSATTEPKKVSTPNAWARGSPVLSPPANKEAVSAPKSPVADARPTVVPGSPKDIDVPRTTGSASTSPRPYLKMGKWDSAATPNLSLQFGSFSLNGMDTLEPTSPRGWASTTTTTTTSSSNNGSKTVTKSTTTQSAWGATAKAASPKKTQSPDRSEQQRAQEASVAKATTSAPPGLSVDSGRVTPTTGQSPRFAPSAPSPASLPKPDEVKRGTPTRAQGGPFQAQGGTAAQANKMNIGYGTGLYQASYGQYSMDLGRPATASTPGQLPAGSGTPKSAGARGGAAAQVAVQSPSRGQQPVAQMQQIPLQQQAQQQQVQQQAQQKQVPSQQTQQPQQNQQNQSQQQTAAQLQQQAQAGMQQGYHYAPPPPPGMALPYNPYNYAGYYQGYGGYYQNPQFAQYSPRTQYPPRGSMPYGVEGPVPGFSNPPNMPYQDQHMMAQQHEYAGAVPQGFGEINAAYMQQAPMQQQGGHHGHHGAQNHGKSGSAPSAGGSGAQQSHGQRGNAGMPGYQNAGARDHASPPVPNASAAMTGSYGQHYWAGNYGAQPVGGWGHMMPQGYQQSPSQQQQVPQQQQQPNAHQQSYQQYGNGGTQAGNTSGDVNPTRWTSS